MTIGENMVGKSASPTDRQLSCWEKVYVFFMDIVGFSLNDDSMQKTIIHNMKSIVQNSPFIKTHKENILKVTGDGVLLIVPSRRDKDAVFDILRFSSYIQGKLKKAKIPVRIGLNCGDAFQISDFQQKPDYIGSVVNDAQRVMDMGDEWHILLHQKFVVEMEKLNSRETKRCANDLGSLLVKHGQNISIFNYVKGSTGNKMRPRKAQMKLIIENLIQDHLFVISKHTEEFLKELGISETKSQVRVSILLRNRYDREFFVSPYRYHHTIGNYGHVKSEVTFGFDNDNPVHSTYRDGKSRCFQIPYDPDKNPGLYRKCWTGSFSGITIKDVKNFTRPSRCYIYVPIGIVDPEKTDMKITFGVLSLDLMSEIPEGNERKALMEFIEKETRYLGYLLASIT